MRYAKIQEESLKNKVAQDFFDKFDCTEIIEKIDFTVKNKSNLGLYLLWAEAKAEATDVCEMLTQLILTIGKARMFDKLTPPPFLGCFDRKKIAFVPYHAVQEIFYQNDFNWKIAPSNKTTREFKLVYDRVEKIIHTDIPGTTYLFNFDKDEKELKHFIKENFVIGKSETTKVPIDKNNFVTIYIKWLEMVKPTIQIDWDKAKKSGIIDGDFYLADLLSFENKTLKEKLYVLLKTDYYELDRKIDELGGISFRTFSFSDNQKAHTQFWSIYQRPPLEEYWDYIVERRDLLVPQDIRERKGSFFTPKIWVELSQKYIADVLGKDWQDEYYVWDCAAGTGNLLTGLTNKYNIWASTLDKADVDVMKDRIRNGANLLEEHVFQFDFLNDDFDKLPEDLRDVINDENKRRRLILYLNPPYVEGDTRIGKGRRGTNISKMHAQYEDKYAKRELYAQFLMRMYREIPGCVIANFSKIKNLQAPYFSAFRNIFRAKLERLFLIPADTFDNVRGQFPIGFFIWNTNISKRFKRIKADVFDDAGHCIGKKSVIAYDSSQYINDWLRPTWNTDKSPIGYLAALCNDFQHQYGIYISSIASTSTATYVKPITIDNLMVSCIYFAVRMVIPADWLNDRDQFLYPNDGWKSDREFRNDCLAYTLFSNNIQSKHGVNYWIPFTEMEVNAKSKFKSNFMTDFLAGKIEHTSNLFTNGKKGKKKVFSAEAKAVFSAGRKLWTYYHSQKKCNVNASLYDIREHFQGRNDKGKMNNKSNDETYNELIANLRSALKTLAKKIEPKVYDYGFLKK